MRGQAFNPVTDGKLDDWYTYRVQDAANIKSYEFNIIRLIVYWELLETSASPGEFSYNTLYVDQLRQTVEAYNAQGIYVYIDLHQHAALNVLSRFIPIAGDDTLFADGFYTDTSASSAREHLKRVWLRLSETFKDYSGVAGYGICNEPHGSGASELTQQQLADAWFDIADYVIASLRNAGDSHIAFVNFAPRSQITNFMSRKLLDNNVVYEVHFYYGLDESTLTLINNDYKWLEMQFDSNVKTKLAEMNVPYIIGELGYSSNSGAGLTTWLGNVLAIMKTHSLLQGWLYWSYNAYGGGGVYGGGGWQAPLVLYATRRLVQLVLV